MNILLKEWENHRGRNVPADASNKQLLQSMKDFYFGASVGIAAMHVITDATELTDDEIVQKINDIYDEINEFMLAADLGPPGPRPKPH